MLGNKQQFTLRSIFLATTATALLCVGWLHWESAREQRPWKRAISADQSLSENQKRLYRHLICSNDWPDLTSSLNIDRYKLTPPANIPSTAPILTQMKAAQRRGEMRTGQRMFWESSFRGENGRRRHVFVFIGPTNAPRTINTRLIVQTDVHFRTLGFENVDICGNLCSASIANGGKLTIISQHPRCKGRNQFLVGKTITQLPVETFLHPTFDLPTSGPVATPTEADLVRDTDAT